MSSTESGSRARRLPSQLIALAVAATCAVAAGPGAAGASAARQSDLPAPGGGPPATVSDNVAPNAPRSAGERGPRREADGQAPAAPGDYANPDASRRPPLPAPAQGGEKGFGMSSSNTYSKDLMVYRGGWVQTSPKIYIVYWGDWSSAGDPYNVQNRLYYFLSGVGGSAWNKTATQYAYNCNTGTYVCPSTATHITNPAGQLMSYWKDTSAVPLTPTDTDLKNEAIRAAQHFGDWSVNAQYVIALPRGRDPQGFVTKPNADGTSYCGYHWHASYGSYRIPFVNLPYMPDAGQYGCHNSSVTGNILDGVTITASHEYFESETDPYVDTGWDDSTHVTGEGGDKCNTYVRNVGFSSGTFPVQAVWSNYDAYYYGSGCMFWST